MTKFTIELDDEIAERLAALSRARNLTVEEWLHAQAETAAAPREDQPVANASHRAILATLERPEGYYGSQRDEVHDRDRERAELYAERRAALLALVDNTQGDMGEQGWNRSKLYDS